MDRSGVEALGERGTGTRRDGCFYRAFETSERVVRGRDGNGMAPHLIMSTPSAIAFLALSLAMLLASAQTGLMKTVSSAQLGGLVLRRSDSGAVILPIVLGWIRLHLALLGLIDTRFGVTLFALSNALCFCFLIWASAAILNRLDAQKSKAEEGLREREQNWN